VSVHASQGDRFPVGEHGATFVASDAMLLPVEIVAFTVRAKLCNLLTFVALNAQIGVKVLAGECIIDV
jgi:hypothetical protein